MAFDPADDDELLAPQGYAGEPEDDHEDTDELEGEWQHSQGFPDTKRAVRIWVDEETRHLTKVRLSTRWRDRLSGRSLDDAFAEAFFLANARVGELPTLEGQEPEEPQADETLNWADLERLTGQFDDLMAKSDELDRRPDDEVRWADLQGEQVSATAANGAVTVTLSLFGLTESVHFDKKWVAKARMTEISEAVMSAHQKAYAKHVPPVFVPGEHEELAQEFAAVRAALETIMSKGIE